MTKEVDEIDLLRAVVIAEEECFGGPDAAQKIMKCDVGAITTGCACLRRARAIREAETAAGFITAKLETLESVKERRG